MIAMDLREPVMSEAHRQLARRIAFGFKKKLPQNVLVEDLEQAAMLGLWDGLSKNADRDYAPEQLEWYLTVRIRGAILDELRAQDWITRGQRRAARAGRAEVRVLHGADTTRSDRDIWEETLAAPEESQDERLDAAKLTRIALAAVDGDPKETRGLRIVREQYLRERTQKAIGRELGISEPRTNQLQSRTLLKLRAALTDVLTEEEHESRASHRRAGTAAPEDRSADAVARAVSGGGLARPPAPSIARLLPRGARSPELGGAAPPGLHRARSEARHAGALAGAGRGLAVTGRAEPVPSVLPEGGLKIFEEMVRYRDWLIDQALLRTRHNVAHAADLVGMNKTYLGRLLKERGIRVPPGPKGRFARKAALVEPAPELAEAEAAAQPEPETPSEPATPALQAERQLARLMERIPWDRVAEWRANGVNDCIIARKLSFTLDVHRFKIEKAAAAPRAGAAAMRRSSRLRSIRYSFWSGVVELICVCGYAGSRAYFWALGKMTRQIDWRA